MRMKRKMRHKSDWKWVRGILAILIIITVWGTAFCGRVHAEETFGQLDSFTGELTDKRDGSGNSSEKSNDTITWITDNMYYDAEKKAYVYTIGEEKVYATVADGMVVKDKVSIKIPDTVSGKLYWQGYSVDFPGGNISQKGNFSVEATYDGVTKQLFSFTIIGNETNQILNYTMPEGFRITKATLDGTEIQYTRKFVDMAKEGHYVIGYECSKTGVSYMLDTIVDTTPPTVVLEGVDDDGKARGPVAVTQKVDKDDLTITRNGEEYKTMLSQVLTQNGRYVVTVTDAAGNSTEYRFVIMVYLDKNAKIFGLLFLLVVVVVIGVFVYYKKHLRVR